MAARISKYWKYNTRLNITEFDPDNITKDNLVNMILLLKQSDVSSSLVMKLFGTFNGEKFCNHYDTFTVPIGGFKFKNEKGKEVSNIVAFDTTFGIWIFNIFLLRDFDFSFIFGGYVNENINAKSFKKMHQKIIYALMENKISTENYEKFVIYTDFLMPWETFLTPTQSEKLLSFTKEVEVLKKKLVEENKEAIDAGDPVVAEKIEKQLLDFALEYLKDDPSLDGYLSGAGGTLGNNFKNMYLMKGAVRNPDPNAKKEFDISTSSFIDGISKDDYAILANSLTGGPYSRAKKTELGGYWEKLISYAMNTIKVDAPNSDCGTDKYLEITLTPDLISAFMYSYIIKSNGDLEELTSDNIDKYINKKIKVRSALFCKSKTGVCHHCAGNFFYRRGNPNMGLACASIATVLKLKSMKAFHNSTINTIEINPLKAFLS